MSIDEAMPDGAWRALAGGPVRLLRSAWPWRSLLYLLTGLPLALAWLAGTAAALVVGLVTAPVGIGLPLLALAPMSGAALAAAERRRLGLVDRSAAPSPHVPPAAPGLLAWFRRRLGEAATWRELAWAPLLCLLGLLDAALALVVVLLVGGLLTAPLQALLLPHVQPNAGWQQILRSGASLAAIWLLGLWGAVCSAYLLTVWAAVRAALSRRLLVRSEDNPLGARIVELTRSRARIVNAYEAERRRLERDLHDGVQQRLTALIMTLGLTRLELEAGPLAARTLAERAHEEARQTLAELRDLVRGIHPAVLSDRGLRAAVEEVAERSPVPVQLAVDLPGRLPDPLESAVYFTVCEALANVAKHSRAARAAVTLRRTGDSLTVEVLDDGVGGAEPGTGGGLVGLADRVAALGGQVRLSSPDGGPTLLRVEMPCGS
jgi:signal transduction histidine kinase